MFKKSELVTELERAFKTQRVAVRPRFTAIHAHCDEAPITMPHGHVWRLEARIGASVVIDDTVALDHRDAILNDLRRMVARHTFAPVHDFIHEVMPILFELRNETGPAGWQALDQLHALLRELKQSIEP